MAELQANSNDIRIAKVIGENEEGLSLFVPKADSGTFQIDQEDRFLTILFVRDAGDGTMIAWKPWVPSR